MFGLLFISGSADDLFSSTDDNNEINNNDDDDEDYEMSTKDKFLKVYHDLTNFFSILWMFLNGSYLYNVYKNGLAAGFKQTKVKKI